MALEVLAIDPGITTGYCFAGITKEAIVLKPFQHKYDVWQHYNLMIDLCPDIVVIEDFQYRNRQRAGLILFSVQLIGVTRLWSHNNSDNITVQTPAQGKGFYSNEQLQRLGAYKRGIPHAMDATRHLFQWLTFHAGSQYTDVDNAVISFI